MSILRSTRYNPGSVYSTSGPRGPNADAFDARPSMDSTRDNGVPGAQQNQYIGNGGGPEEEYRHSRYEDAYHDGNRAYPNEYEGYDNGEQNQYGHDGYGHGGYDNNQSQGQGGYAFTTQGGGYVNHPQEALSRNEEVTPTLNNYSDGQGVGYAGNGGLRRPEGVQNHPGEFYSQSRVFLVGNTD
jgi:hypothetical protein